MFSYSMGVRHYSDEHRRTIRLVQLTPARASIKTWCARQESNLHLSKMAAR
jgi:hypothetical protein